nr:hypothetical protein [Tanacetum cinerariifolium]
MLKQEKERNQLKIEKIDNASKSLDKLIGSKIPNNSKKGLGYESYHAVPPPPTRLFSPPKLDLSNSGLEEFKQPEFESYEPKSCEIESKNTARPVSTAHPKTTVYSARPTLCFLKSAQSTVKRPYQQRTSLTNKIFCQKVNTAKGKFYTARSKPVNTSRPRLVNTARPRPVNIARPRPVNTARPNSAVVNVVRVNQIHPQKEYQGYVDSGCSRHMTGNMSYLSEFKKFDGGYVTFGRGAKRGRITCKGTLKTGKLNFEDVYFVKELKFNLLSVSQICDKKNNILFTGTGGFVLSPNFKLTDEIHVLLKFPRRNNMYSIDMKNIIPKESLTCLVAKAVFDESMLWHRRLGHINFKIINKMVKDNVVRGLPLKHFKNDQTCVACLKGKQYKASYKSKVQNSISQPLFMMHMDLFCSTFMSNLMHKKYNGCSRHMTGNMSYLSNFKEFDEGYVNFGGGAKGGKITGKGTLKTGTKDETNGILKRFKIKIENLVDKKVKIIRCDNGTEFKNIVMSEFYEKKRIKKEFSIARTPQQDGVAERRNMTLIEAARTMLADSKLPTTFWAEAVIQH